MFSHQEVLFSHSGDAFGAPVMSILPGTPGHPNFQNGSARWEWPEVGLSVNNSFAFKNLMQKKFLLLIQEKLNVPTHQEWRDGVISGFSVLRLTGTHDSARSSS